MKYSKEKRYERFTQTYRERIVIGTTLNGSSSRNEGNVLMPTSEIFSIWLIHTHLNVRTRWPRAKSKAQRVAKF